MFADNKQSSPPPPHALRKPILSTSVRTRLFVGASDCVNPQLRVGAPSDKSLLLRVCIEGPNLVLEPDQGLAAMLEPHVPHLYAAKFSAAAAAAARGKASCGARDR